MGPQEYSTKPSMREPSLSVKPDHEGQLPESCASTPSTQGSSTQANAGSSGGESRPVTDDGVISWQHTLYFDVEPDDTEEDRGEIHERSRSHEESDSCMDSESLDGSDAYEEASENATIDTSKGKGSANSDSTVIIAGVSTKAKASSEPGPSRLPARPANQIDSRRYQDRFLNANEAPLDHQTYGGYTRQLGRPQSPGRPHAVRGLHHHEYQQIPTRTGGRSPYSPHRSAMAIPRQCIPCKGLRTTTDRWHEVPLLFHISRIDESSRSQQLVVFDVDNYYLYAFALANDISVLRGGSEPDEEEDCDHLIDQTSATEEDVSDKVSADGNESLHQHERFQDALEEVQAIECEEAELYDVCCSECHGRGWLKGDDTNVDVRRVSVHHR